MKTILMKRFESIGAYARYAQDTLDKTPQKGSESVEAPSRHEWCLNTTLQEAVAIGVTGGRWIEGARELQSVDIQAQTAKIAAAISPELVHDVTGGMIDIPEYLAGQSPECFLRVDEDEMTAKPVLRIATCVMPCYRITATAFMNHGRAILALCDALEMLGYAVELIGSDNHVSENNVYTHEITVKSAGQQWDAASAAFALAHPAFGRRIGFRALEFSEGSALTLAGYGRGSKDNPSDDYDVYFPYLLHNTEIETPELALDYVVRQFKQQQPDIGL